MPFHVGERVGRQPVGSREHRQVVAQPRPLAAPASHAHVGVIPFREHPAVATRDDAELDHRRGLVRLAAEQRPRRVALQRHAARDVGAQLGRARDDAVRAVGADERVGAHALCADARHDTVVLERQIGDAAAETHVGAGLGRVLREVCVETAPLRHQDQRLPVAARELAAVAQAQAEPVDDVLHDGCDVARRVTQRSPREPAAARLVARKARLVGEQDPGASACEVDRRRGSRGPRTRDSTSQCCMPRVYAGLRSAAVNRQ